MVINQLPGTSAATQDPSRTYFPSRMKIRSFKGHGAKLSRKRNRRPNVYYKNKPTMYKYGNKLPNTAGTLQFNLRDKASKLTDDSDS